MIINSVVGSISGSSGLGWPGFSPGTVVTLTGGGGSATGKFISPAGVEKLTTKVNKQAAMNL